MSDLSVRAKALADEATPGPWLNGYDDGSGRVTAHTGADISCPAQDGGRSWVINGGCDDWGIQTGVITDADAEFIAASRELVPPLAAEVERLETRVNTLEAAQEENLEVLGEWRHKAEELVGRNEQLQAELHRVGSTEVGHWYARTLKAEQEVSKANDVVRRAEFEKEEWEDNCAHAAMEREEFFSVLSEGVRLMRFWWTSLPKAVREWATTADALLASLEDSPQ